MSALLGLALASSMAATAVARPVFGDRPETVAERMMLGAAAPAPQGFVEFCQRQPEDCDQSVPAADPALVSTGSPTASISTSGPRLDATSPLVASWLSNLDFKTLAAPTAGASGVERIDWSREDLDRAGPAPLTQISLALLIERAFPTVRSLGATEQIPVATAVEASDQGAAASIHLTSKTWAQINKINRKINRAIAQRTDLEIYGREEVWAMPLEDGQRFGDCEDFVLEKRRALIAAGFPPKALSIAAVLTSRNERHAVLLINSEAGEYVLDNLNSWVIPWDKAGYRWRERQVAGSANQWVGVQPAMSTKGDRDYYTQVLLASLH